MGPSPQWPCVDLPPMPHAGRGSLLKRSGRGTSGLVIRALAYVRNSPAFGSQASGGIDPATWVLHWLTYGWGLCYLKASSTPRAGRCGRFCALDTDPLPEEFVLQGPRGPQNGGLGRSCTRTELGVFVAVPRSGGTWVCSFGPETWVCSFGPLSHSSSLTVDSRLTWEPFGCF